MSSGGRGDGRQTLALVVILGLAAGPLLDLTGRAVYAFARMLMPEAPKRQSTGSAFRWATDTVNSAHNEVREGAPRPQSMQ